MNILFHAFALFGLCALLVFGPQHQVETGTAENSGNGVPFILLVIPFAMSYLWWFLVGEKLH
jgi:hypothetical protein